MNAHHTDPAFLATAFSIPDSLKIHGRTQKYILRKAGAGLLPESILNFGKSFNRLKHDLQFSAVLDRLADELLSPAAVGQRGLFEPSYVSALRRRPCTYFAPLKKAVSIAASVALGRSTIGK